MRTRVVASSLGLFLGVHLCAARDLGSLEWFKSTWDDAIAFTIPDRSMIEFSITMYPTMTAQEVEALAASIAATPDHPSWMRVRRERRLLVLGHADSQYRLWTWDAEHWRVSQDLQEELTPFVDYGAIAERLWTYTPVQLTVGTSGSLPKKRDSSRVLEIRADELKEVLAFGMGVGIASDIKPVSAEWDGDRWTGTAQNATGDKVVAWVGARREGGEGLDLEQWEVLRNDRYPKGVGLTCRFTASEWSGDLSRVVPASALQFQPNGDPYREVSLRQARTLLRDEFESISRVPEVGKEDAIRGVVRPLTFADYRPGRGVLVDERHGARTVVPLPDARTGSDSRWLVWAGRMLAALVISVVLWLGWSRWRDRFGPTGISQREVR